MARTKSKSCFGSCRGAKHRSDFQARLNQPGASSGQVTLKKEGLAGNPTAYFVLDAQDKLKVLVVDGDPQTSLVQSETFFSRARSIPRVKRDSSLYLPTVIIPDGLNAASLDAYQVVVLCNVSAMSDTAVAKLQNFLRQGGGLLIFGGDRVQTENYNVKLAQSSPPIFLRSSRTKSSAPKPAEKKSARWISLTPPCKVFPMRMLQESIKSARVWGYSRTRAPGKAVLISLANGDPLLLEQKVGTGRVLFMTTSADRDWNDLPVKTAYLPLIQSLTNYLAGGKRGAMDGGIPVGQH